MSTRGDRRVVVVGGGIAGLATAHRVHRLEPEAEVTVLEAAATTGGKIRTTTIAGMAIDEAADAFLARVPTAVGLCRELGLGDQLVSPAERRAFVWRHGALHRFPEGLVLGVPTDLDALAASGLVSPEGVARAAEDLDLPADLPGAPAPGEDESVGSLVRRRVGDEVFEALVGPLLSGVNAGDADELSLEGGAPQLAAAVRDQPSLIAGLRAQRAAALAADPDPDAPVFHGLRGGSGTLVRALVEHLPHGAVRTAEPATSLVAHGDELVVSTASGDLTADAVVLAVPTFAAAPLVEGLDAALAAELTTLAWSSVVLVTMVVRRGGIAHPLDGSGFLVAEHEGLLMTACSFGSSKWAHWRPGGERPAGSSVADDPDDLVVLRVSAGRHHDPRAWAMADDELQARLVEELGTTIGLAGPGAVVAARPTRWAQALPQYRPGHLARARAWKAAATAAHPGLHLVGAGYLGLGIPAIVADADATARAIAGAAG